MDKKLILIASVFISLFVISVVSAQAVNNASIITANLSEFNTATPTITVNVSGNCTGYLANWTLNGVKVKSAQAVNNATSTSIVATTSTSTAGNYTYNVTFYNATCYAGSSDTENRILEVNGRPSISTVTGNGGAFLKGKTITWTNTWTDSNSTGTDSVTLYSCKTNAFTSAGCTGGQWGVSSAETDGSTAVNYTILVSDTGGTKNAYIFAIDDNNYSVSSSTQANFVVSKPIEGETYESDEEDEGISKGWIIGVIIAIVLIAVLIKKK